MHDATSVKTLILPQPSIPHRTQPANEICVAYRNWGKTNPHDLLKTRGQIVNYLIRTLGTSHKHL